MKNIKKIALGFVLAITAGCSVLIKESQMQDHESIAKIAKDVVFSYKFKNIKVKNIAIVGFVSPAFASQHTQGSLAIVSAVNDLSTNRSCNALDYTYELAPKMLSDYGFNVLNEEKLAHNSVYKKMGSDSFPGLCNAGNTRINIGFFQTDDLNKVMNDLNLDGVLITNLSAEYDNSQNENLYLWVKGEKTAELAWQANLGRRIYVESDAGLLFRDLQELSKSNKERMALTAKVYINSFKLMASKLAEEMM